jgi:hypothetical protein
MADLFGTGAGIVGVISLAIQITQVVVKFGMDWEDAPENLKTFMAELGTLKTVLSETNSNIILNPDFAAAFQGRQSLLLSQLGPNALSTTDTKLMLEICRRHLESLLKELKLRGQGRRFGWERFKGAFLAKDTRDSVENLCRQCQTLNNMLSIDAIVLGASTYREVKDVRREQQEWRQAEAEISSAIRGGVDQSNQRQENQQRQNERQAIFDWLTPVDYTSQQNDFISRRQEGTGKWLLDSTEFQTWLNTDKQTIFCPGIPGAGKTILTAVVIEEITAQFSNDLTTGIAYIYCNFRRHDEQKINDLLASLLKQLSMRQLSLPGCLKDLYDEHKVKGSRPSLEEISRLLQAVATVFSRLFLIVDALDECQVSDRCRSTFISSIFNLQAKTGAKLFTTSRPIPDIEREFKGFLSREILATDGDIRRYLDGHMSQLPVFVLSRLNLQEDIKNEISKAANGMLVLC